MTSFYGIIDLLALLPSYLGFAIGANTNNISSIKTIRTIRLIRIFRILKLIRYVKEAKALKRSLYCYKATNCSFLICGAINCYFNGNYHLFN